VDVPQKKHSSARLFPPKEPSKQARPRVFSVLMTKTLPRPLRTWQTLVTRGGSVRAGYALSDHGSGVTPRLSAGCSLPGP